MYCEIIMNKLLLAISIASLSLVGCSTHKEATAAPTVNEMQYGVKNLQEHTTVNTNFSLETEAEYKAAELYGSIAFKAIAVCNSKFENLLKNIDMSSDYGATVLQEYQVKVEKCVDETLKPYPIIPEKDRVQLPRENVGLELNESEIAGFNDVDDFENELPAIAGEDKSYRDDPAFQKALPACAAANIEIKNDKEFVEAVDFCALKAM
uniref:Lipoprotein n=1 Tax=Acinetobacter phage vB_AbaSt_W16 TaxID=3116434 RepID=A0AB38ZCU2_9CAUD